MQTVALSLYRFTGWRKAWAFAQMGMARRALAGLPGLEFHKMFGTGTGEGFTPVPNLAVYALMTVWPDGATARARLAEAPVFARYRRRAAETADLLLSPVSSRGAWDGQAPFRTDGDARPSPIAVLTRATLHPSAMRGFWRNVPGIEGTIRGEDQLLMKVGMGEVPWLQQVTFSIWQDDRAMQDFAYRSQHHREAIRRVREGGWFKEELYARFAVTSVEGLWEGRPLAATLARGAQPLAN
ncbi:MAG: DUF3291 domain-containing protein, partial [Pseudomonadota bacterium]